MLDSKTRISDTAKVFRDAKLVDCVVGDYCCVADYAELRRVKMSSHSEVGRRSIVFDSSIGFGSYIGSNSIIRNADIGKYCSLSWNLSIGGADHDYTAPSMYTDYWWKRVFDVNPGRASGDVSIVIGNDVWIGAGANVLAGVHIGHGAVVGAAALVLKDVPAYAIVGGIPAKVLKYRFPDDVCNQMLSIAWWDWDIETVSENAALLSSPITEESLERMQIIAQMERRRLRGMMP